MTCYDTKRLKKHPPKKASPFPQTTGSLGRCKMLAEQRSRTPGAAPNDGKMMVGNNDK